MSEFYRGDFDRAFAAFSYLATRVPLTEIYNNMGVVEARRGHRASAVTYFSKAVSADPKDADCRFNLGVALFKNGDSAGAARQLKTELQQRPTDGEAKSLLDRINRGASAPPAAAAGNAMLPANQPQPHLPMERIQRTFNEASYRQLVMEINNLTAAHLAKLDDHDQANYHVARGKELLSRNMPQQAEAEFRAAIQDAPNNEAAHAQLAMLLEKKGDLAGARAEAQTSVRMKPNVDALLVLARIDLKQDQVQAAAGEVTRALVLEPANSSALALNRDIAARQTGSK